MAARHLSVPYTSPHPGRTRAAAVVLVVVASVALLVGLRDTTARPTTVAASTDALTAAVVADMSVGTPALPVRPTQTSGGHEYSIAWTLDAIATAPPRLVISSKFGGCTTFDYVQVDETPTTVTVTVHTRHRSDPCPQDLAHLLGYVPLATPLRSRSLIHAATTSAG